jgi:hypothetical protein
MRKEEEENKEIPSALDDGCVWVGVELRLRADVRSSSQMCGVAFLDLSSLSLSLPFSSRGGERDDVGIPPFVCSSP